MIDFAHGYDAAAKDDAAEFARLDAEIAGLRAALGEIVLRSSPYQDDHESWPLVAGINKVAREALAAKRN